MVSILIINTDPIASFLRRLILKKENYKLLMANDEQEALEILKNKKVDYVFLDINMTTMPAIDFINKCKSIFIDISNFVVWYAVIRESERNELKKIGITKIFERPLTKEKLYHIISSD